MHSPDKAKVDLVLLLALLPSMALLTNCGKGGKRVPAIGEAYVGPAVLQIRSDPQPQSSVVATAKRGERVELLEEKRKLARIRTAAGAEGWADERQLLAASDMAALNSLTERAAHLPTQGQATTYGELRVHTQPSYDAPSFLTIKPNEKFEVLEYAILPRHEAARTPLVPPPPPKKKAEPKKFPKNPKLLPPPPLPKPPGPPPNWVELSKSNEPQPPPESSGTHTDKPVQMDRWSLIRTPNGQSGWVYTRMISMAIPDEVAQYAEGHRIVSYFPLGTVQDKGQSKNTWVWTTASSSVDASYDFDSFRVFIWSLRRHRYETAHIELHLKGYLPVLQESVEASAGKGKADTGKATYPGFSVCVLRKDGVRSRREYALVNERIRSAGEQPCEAATPPVAMQAAAPLAAGQKISTEQSKENLWQRIKRRWHALTK